MACSKRCAWREEGTPYYRTWSTAIAITTSISTMRSLIPTRWSASGTRPIQPRGLPIWAERDPSRRRRTPRIDSWPFTFKRSLARPSQGRSRVGGRPRRARAKAHRVPTVPSAGPNQAHGAQVFHLHADSSREVFTERGRVQGIFEAQRSSQYNAPAPHPGAFPRAPARACIHRPACSRARTATAAPNPTGNPDACRGCPASGGSPGRRDGYRDERSLPFRARPLGGRPRPHGARGRRAFGDPVSAGGHAIRAKPGAGARGAGPDLYELTIAARGVASDDFALARLGFGVTYPIKPKPPTSRCTGSPSTS